MITETQIDTFFTLCFIVLKVGIRTGEIFLGDLEPVEQTVCPGLVLYVFFDLGNWGPRN